MRRESDCHGIVEPIRDLGLSSHVLTANHGAWIMHMRYLVLLTTVFVGAAQLPAYAQSSGSTTGAGIDQRESNQQARIQQGINSGALTPGEAGRLEHREQSIANQEQRMRARDGGELTAKDRAVLNNRLNRTSNAIYRDKHNNKRAF